MEHKATAGHRKLYLATLWQREIRCYCASCISVKPTATL